MVHAAGTPTPSSPPAGPIAAQAQSHLRFARACCCCVARQGVMLCGMARLGQQGRSPCSISIWGPGRSGRRTRSRHPCRARAAAVRWSARTKVGNKSSGGTSGYRRDLGEVALAAAHPVHCKVTLLEWEYFAALPRHSLSPLRLGVGSWAVHGAVGATRGMGLWRLFLVRNEGTGAFFLFEWPIRRVCSTGMRPWPGAASESPGGGQPWC